VAVDLSRELAARIGVELVQVPYPRPGAVMAGLRADFTWVESVFPGMV
jgi:hypothetical protein